MSDMTFDYETCSQCGMCALICGTKAIDHEKGEYPSRNQNRADTCMLCGQCMLVCPTASIHIADLSYDDLFELPKVVPDYSALFDLMATRRSVRHFKNKPVPRDLLEKIIEAVALAPMGAPPHKTHITVVQNRDTIMKMMPFIIKFYEDLTGWIKNPIIRYKIKKNNLPEVLPTLQNHAIPLLKKRIPEMKKTGNDEITWGATAMMLFHAEELAESHTIDACIALTYAFLSAHALGLGVTVSGLVPPAVNKVPELHNMLGIPENHDTVCAMIIGYPRYRYLRGIKRPLAGLTWV